MASKPMPKPNIASRIWTTNEANTPARTGDQVQAKKACGSARVAMSTSSEYDFGFNIKFICKFLRGQNLGRFGGLIIRKSIGGLTMTFGRGALLWLLGIPLPIILLLALFWR